jgi:hypothetical protein
VAVGGGGVRVGVGVGVWVGGSGVQVGVGVGVLLGGGVQVQVAVEVGGIGVGVAARVGVQVGALLDGTAWVGLRVGTGVFVTVAGWTACRADVPVGVATGSGVTSVAQLLISEPKTTSPIRMVAPLPTRNITQGSLFVL